MKRVLAGIAASLMLITGATLMWRGSARAPTSQPVLDAPVPRFAAAAVAATPVTLAPIGPAPSADPKSKDEKRFARADKNDDGRITWPNWSSRGARPSPSSTSTRTANFGSRNGR